jgi:tetratricopeptide (TPR) repeat protein
MRNYTGNLKRMAGALAISTVFLFPAFGQDPNIHQQRVTVEETDSLRANLDIAHAQHEIILLYIENNQFDKVWPAAQVLLSIRFPAEQEAATATSVRILTGKLYAKGQPALAHQILSAAAKSFNDKANKATVYLLQAKAYKLDGLYEKAIECLQKFQELSGKSPE